MIPARIPLCRRCDDAGFVGAGETLDACPDCAWHAEAVWRASQPFQPISNDRDPPRPFDPAKFQRSA